MTDVKVTQGSLEVLIEPERPDVKITQGAFEVFLSPARPSAKITQVAIEVLHNDPEQPPGPPYPEESGSVRDTQALSLALTSTEAQARNTQAAALVLYAPATTARNTQGLALALIEQETTARNSQAIALVLGDHQPCITHHCNVWIIRRTDGVIFGFTSLDVSVTFKGVVCSPCGSLSGSAVNTSSDGGAVSNMEMSGIISSGKITDSDLSNGLYDGAFVEVWRIPWNNAGGETAVRLVAGNIGNIQKGVTNYKAEVLSAGALAQQRPLLDSYTPQCRWILGDSRCSVDIDSLAVTGSVTSTTIPTGPNLANKRIFNDAANLEADNYFDYGSIEFTTGNNAGYVATVKQFVGGRFVLWETLPYSIEVGDQYTVKPGCDKLPDTCKDKYSNFDNYGGFPHIPGTDFMFKTPNAK